MLIFWTVHLRSTLLVLLICYPRVWQYAARVLSDNAGQYFFLALLLVASKPYVIALLPVSGSSYTEAPWCDDTMGLCDAKG